MARSHERLEAQRGAGFRAAVEERNSADEKRRGRPFCAFPQEQEVGAREWTAVTRIRRDLNNPVFQADWFALEHSQARAVLSTLEKIHKTDGDQFLPRSWVAMEAILSRKGPSGQRIYSFRITLRMRAVAYRDEDYLRLLSIRADHDSAYR